MQEYNIKADIWSVGCVVFEMLVGVPPFKGQNPRELFMNIRSKHIQIPPDVSFSVDLQQLILRVSIEFISSNNKYLFIYLLLTYCFNSYLKLIQEIEFH